MEATHWKKMQTDSTILNYQQQQQQHPGNGHQMNINSSDNTAVMNMSGVNDLSMLNSQLNNANLAILLNETASSSNMSNNMSTSMNSNKNSNGMSAITNSNSSLSSLNALLSSHKQQQQQRNSVAVSPSPQLNSNSISPNSYSQLQQLNQLINMNNGVSESNQFTFPNNSNSKQQISNQIGGIESPVNMHNLNQMIMSNSLMKKQQQQQQHLMNSNQCEQQTNSDVFQSASNGASGYSQNFMNQESLMNMNLNGSNSMSNGNIGLFKRELGVVEKVFSSYGFIKCMSRECRLFFHNSSYQQNSSNNSAAANTELKVGDIVEFEESLDKRNGKPLAINLIRHDKTSLSQLSSNGSKALNGSSSNLSNGTNGYQNALGSSKHSHSTGNMIQQNQMNIDSSLNLTNLKELLLNGTSGMSNNSGLSNAAASLFNQQQQSYQYLMNGLKMLNMQQSLASTTSAAGSGPNSSSNLSSANLYDSAIGGLVNNSGNVQDVATASSLQSIMSLYNKENMTQKIQANGNLKNNLMGLSKNAATSSANDSSQSEQISNEMIEGIIVIAAMKQPAGSANFNGMSVSPPILEGRITYQRNGETFYIPYSLSDVINSGGSSGSGAPMLKIGDRVRFCIGQTLNGLNKQQQQLFAQLQIPIQTNQYAKRVELVKQPAMHSSMTSMDTSGAANMFRLSPPHQYQQQQQQQQKHYRGIITTLKDSFGKIEREDQFKETFFHFNDYRGKNASQELRIGLNVEFEIQDRYGKEIACNIIMLPEGTVNFDELSRNIFVGRILQAPLLSSQLNGGSNLSASGRLIFDNNDENLVELTFGEHDRIGEYTLLEGDFVEFRIASDKRRTSFSQRVTQRATQISLIEEHSLSANSPNTNEHRERGILTKFFSASELLSASATIGASDLLSKIKYGAIKCIEQDELVYFTYSEVISFVRFTSNINEPYAVNEVKLEIGDSLEFSVITCQRDAIFKNGLKAIRVCKLAKNSVQFQIISEELCTGFIEKEAAPMSAVSSLQIENVGLIRFEDKSNKGNKSKSMAIAYSPFYQQQVDMMLGTSSSETSSDAQLLVGDQVEFNICTCIKTKQQYACNVRLIEPRKEQGFITMLKENYGFIEFSHMGLTPSELRSTSAVIPRDIFFHFSSLICLVADLEIGDDVEFTINRKSKQKLSAENVLRLLPGTIKPLALNAVVPTTYKGRVIQPLRSQNTNNLTLNSQELADEAYYGKIQTLNENNKKDSSADLSIIQFGLFSQDDKRVNLQNGDLVTFQMIEVLDGSARKAFHVQLQHQALQQQQQQQQQSASSSQEQASSRTRTGDYKKGKVESVKGHCGFIEYAAGAETKKLFFHVSDVSDSTMSSSSTTSNASDFVSLKPGDDVEFMISHNPRNGKYSATRIRRLINLNQKSSAGSLVGSSSSAASSSSTATAVAEDCKRPERLITKLKLANIDDKSGKQLVMTRQPNNPDGKTKSFSRQLRERLPGSLTPLADTVVSNSSTLPATDVPDVDSEINPIVESGSSLSIIDLLMSASAASS